MKIDESKKLSLIKFSEQLLNREIWYSFNQWLYKDNNINR
jgi:hypothetical protein